MNYIIYFAIAVGILAIILTIFMVVMLLRANRSNNNLKYRNVKINDEYYQLMPIKESKNYLDLTIKEEKFEEQVNTEEIVKIKEEVVKELPVSETNVTNFNVLKNDTSEVKVIKSPKLHLDHKLKLVIHYSNIVNPFLNVSFYSKGKLQSQKKYLLNDYQIEDGKILNIEAISNLIKSDFNVSAPIVLLLSSNDIFKNVVSLPKISKGKADKLYLKELKETFPNYKADYDLITNNYKHDLGYIYNTYFVSHKVIEDFKLLATLLNTKIINVDIFGNYIYKKIKNSYDGSYSVIYKEDDYCLLLNVYNNQLTTIYNFNSNNVEEIINQYLLIVSKHEFNFEKKSIKTLLVSDSIYFDVKDKLKVDVKPLELDLNNYTGEK